MIADQPPTTPSHLPTPSYTSEAAPSLDLTVAELPAPAGKAKLVVARVFALVAGFLLTAQLALPWVYLSGATVFGLTLGTSAFRGHPESGPGFVVAVLIAIAGTVAASGSFMTRPAKVAGPVGLFVSLITVAIVVPTSAVVAEQKLSPSDVFPSALIWAPAWCMAAALLLFAAAALTSPADYSSSSSGTGATAETS